MADTKKLLQVKKTIKKNQPVFLRQDWHKKVKLGLKWRKPKGMHSKVRLCHGGHRKMVKAGFGSPAVLRDTNSQGLKQVVVHSLPEVEAIESKTQCIIIAKVGLKNKVALIKEAQKRKIVIMNVKDPSKFVEEVEKKMQEKLKAKTEHLKKKEEKAKDKEKAAKEKKDEGLATKVEDEEKKKLEKEEKDKVLIQRSA